jgi:hypothetical protein
MASDSQGPTIIGVTMLFWVMALVALGLRFWSLQIRRRRVFAHDLLVLLGFVSSIRPVLLTASRRLLLTVDSFASDLCNSSHCLPHRQRGVRRARAACYRADQHAMEADYFWKGEDDIPRQCGPPSPYTSPD